MQRGITVANPYASVNIPRTRLENSFVKRYLGEEPPSPTVIVNPGAVPTYPAPEQLNGASKPASLDSWDGSKILTRESWAQPYNPYASLKLENGTSSTTMYSIELDKHQKSPEAGPDSSCICCWKHCHRCRKCHCVVS
ncbi:cysteine-rich tail protein 1-like [Emydura macquarii macquarii]|uniref:cysteine-rich tail protein 1-like n=1 Tax=Emydura macquarii macquarii TaxID=1129001 RepID=UPI00352B1185